MLSRCLPQTPPPAAPGGRGGAPSRDARGAGRGAAGAGAALGAGLALLVVFFGSGFAGEPLAAGTAAGSGSTSPLPLSEVWRGQEKSSARPDGAAIGSPWTSTRVATGSG